MRSYRRRAVHPQKLLLAVVVVAFTVAKAGAQEETGLAQSPAADTPPRDSRSRSSRSPGSPSPDSTPRDTRARESTSRDSTTRDSTTPAERSATEQPAEPSRSETVLAPNLLGDLLFANRSLTFTYNRASGFINVANPGSTSIVNSAIADDNSPLPQDRVGFRYNHFASAESVTGFGPAVVDARGVGTAFADSRQYNLDRYTFNVEKTFFDQLVSLELRVPFDTTLSSNLDLGAGAISGPIGPGGSFPVTSTPGDTLGRSGTQLEDLSLILKGLLFRGDMLAVSGGLGMTVPTGADTNVRVTDYAGPTPEGVATIQRVRTFHIDNETWALSPFLAFLANPTDRFFAQGFLEFDFPLNASTINYSDVYTQGSSTQTSVTVLQALGRQSFSPTLNAPYSVKNGISDQPLMHVDLGTGYWLLRDPCRPLITGIVPTLELHYTTTLKDASIVTLPADTLLTLNAQNKLVQEPPPQVGNMRNRVDLLDMTAGTTFFLADRASLAIGAAFPLLGGDNRTFDWELHLQLNLYFGGSRRRLTPNF